MKFWLKTEIHLFIHGPIDHYYVLLLNLLLKLIMAKTQFLKKSEYIPFLKKGRQQKSESIFFPWRINCDMCHFSEIICYHKKYLICSICYHRKIIFVIHNRFYTNFNVYFYRIYLFICAIETCIVLYFFIFCCFFVKEV